MEVRKGEAKDYYVPGEVCDPIGQEWFAINDDRPRSDAELLGMRLIFWVRSRQRTAKPKLTPVTAEGD